MAVGLVETIACVIVNFVAVSPLDGSSRLGLLDIIIAIRSLYAAITIIIAVRSCDGFGRQIVVAIGSLNMVLGAGLSSHM